jgi:hypothetical protein
MTTSLSNQLKEEVLARTNSLLPFDMTRTAQKKMATSSAVYETCISESESLYDCQFTANQFVLAPSPLRLTTSIFFN